MWCAYGYRFACGVFIYFSSISRTSAGRKESYSVLWWRYALLCGPARQYTPIFMWGDVCLRLTGLYCLLRPHVFCAWLYNEDTVLLPWGYSDNSLSFSSRVSMYMYWLQALLTMVTWPWSYEVSSLELWTTCSHSLTVNIRRYRPCSIC